MKQVLKLYVRGAEQSDKHRHAAITFEKGEHPLTLAERARSALGYPTRGDDDDIIFDLVCHALKKGPGVKVGRAPNWTSYTAILLEEVPTISENEGPIESADYYTLAPKNRIELNHPGEEARECGSTKPS